MQIGRVIYIHTVQQGIIREHRKDEYGRHYYTVEFWNGDKDGTMKEYSEDILSELIHNKCYYGCCK